MPKIPEGCTCPRCSGMALYIEVRKYFWTNANGDRVAIDDAEIIKCRRCGEFPATDEEQKRWKVIDTKEKVKEINPDEPTCETCGKARSRTGQFFEYGSPPDKKGYCRECNDALGSGEEGR